MPLIDTGIAVSASQERVHVIIPMYKVEPYIQDVIAGIPSWVERIILVDDASPDRSGKWGWLAGIHGWCW